MERELGEEKGNGKGRELWEYWIVLRRLAGNGK